MALPPAVLLGLVLIDRVWVTPWSQQGTELVVIRVVDADSGRPVVGANVGVSGDTVQTLRSDPDGIAAFAVPYRIEGTTSPFRERRRSEARSKIIVASDGYSTSNTPLGLYRTGLGRDYRLPNPIDIGLRR